MVPVIRFLGVRLLQACLLGAGLLGACCVFGPSARLIVKLPEPPPQWRTAFPDLQAVLEYPDKGGGMAFTRLERWPEGAEVECAKTGNGPILAWPVLPGDTEPMLRPAGGLYPADISAPPLSEHAPEAPWGRPGYTELALQWEEGPLALIIARLYRQGFDVSRVNTVRLRESLHDSDDPWAWDTVEIADKLSAGTFTYWHLDLLPTADVRVNPGSGTWFLDSPFDGTRITDSAGWVDLPRLTFGMHLLSSLEGSRLGLWLDEKEVVTMSR